MKTWLLSMVVGAACLVSACSSSGGGVTLEAPASGPPGPPTGPPAGTVATRSRSGEADPSSTVNNIAVSLNPGWNAVALQCQQVTSLAPSSSIVGMAVFNGTGYTTQDFNITNLNGGAGAGRGQAVWVFASAATSFTYSGNDPGTPGVIDLNINGYQLVSSCSNANVAGSSLTATRNGQSVPLGTAVLPQFVEVGAGNQYTTVDVQSGGVLKPGAAYWVYANTDGGAVRLHYPVASASPTPTPTPTPAASPAGPSPAASPSTSPAPVPAPSLAAHTNTLYDNFNQSYTVPYDGNPGFGGDKPPSMPQLAVQVFGQTFYPQIDTGSRGLRITENLLPASVVKSLTGFQGSIFYWSSGRSYNGLWTTTNVTFPGAQASGGAPLPAVARVPVLIQQTQVCQAGDWPNACSPVGTVNTTGPNDIKEVFMGIGFDRTGDGDVPENDEHNQDYNPLLNLLPMQAKTMIAGYILTPQGVQLGLTKANTSPSANGTSYFSFAQLLATGLAQVPNAPPDWQTALGRVSTDAKSNGDHHETQPTNYPLGEAVIDTGIGNMLLTLPGFPTKGSVTNGTLGVSLLGLPDLVGYGFSAGQQPPANQAAPTGGVTLSPLQRGRFSQTTSPPTNTSFLNTGRDVLSVFNYLYDATNGYVGLQTNNASPLNTAFTFPAFLARGVMKFTQPFTTDLAVYVEGDATISTSTTATFDGPITGNGKLTISGGGTVTFNRGSYKDTTVSPDTKLIVNEPSAGNVKAIPIVCESGSNGKTKPRCHVRINGGPPILALIDTGSNALVVNQLKFPGYNSTIPNNATINYTHCTAPRPGYVSNGTLAILDKAGGTTLIETAQMPIMVGENSTFTDGYDAIMGMRMIGANLGSGAGIALPSAKLFLPPPFNQAYVLDIANDVLYLGTFPSTDFGTVQLPAMATCNQTVPNPLPCWDDSAIPVKYHITGKPNGPLALNSLFDAGAGTSIQLTNNTKPDYLVVNDKGKLENPVLAVLQTSQGQLQLPLDPLPDVVINGTRTEVKGQPVIIDTSTCNGQICNTGVKLFNTYQMLFDQANGLVGLRPSKVGVTYAKTPTNPKRVPSARRQRGDLSQR